MCHLDEKESEGAKQTKASERKQRTESKEQRRSEIYANNALMREISRRQRALSIQELVGSDIGC
jgi:hypothetical protein